MKINNLILDGTVGRGVDDLVDMATTYHDTDHNEKVQVIAESILAENTPATVSALLAAEALVRLAEKEREGAFPA